MNDPRKPSRLVYSTGGGRLCGKCGWPETACRCSSNLRTQGEPVPEKITVNLSVEKRGSGKTVTVIDGLPANRDFCDTLARDLKRSCGTGGRAAETFIELQGDHRERLRDLLQRRGWRVRG